MATRAERLPAIRRLAVDPSATSAERESAARFAARLEPQPRSAKPRTRASHPRSGITLERYGDQVMLRWACPRCGQTVVHGEARDNLLALALHLRTAAREQRTCWVCSLGPHGIWLADEPVPGAVPEALWIRMRSPTTPQEIRARSDFLNAVARAADQAPGLPLTCCDKRSIRRRVVEVLTGAHAAGVLREIPTFTLRARQDGRVYIHWRAR